MAISLRKQGRRRHRAESIIWRTSLPTELVKKPAFALRVGHNQLVYDITVIVIVDNLQIGPRNDPASQQVIHRYSLIGVVKRIIKRIQKIVATALEARLFSGLVGMLGNPGGHLFQSGQLPLRTTSGEASSSIGNHRIDFLARIVDELAVAAVLYLRGVRVGVRDLQSLRVDLWMTDRGIQRP